jgi:predicted nucleic acid-binding protein
MPDRYFVIDTNVVISIAVFSSLSPAASLKKALSIGKLAFSEPVLQEYAETLPNPKFDKYLSMKGVCCFLKN